MLDETFILCLGLRSFLFYDTETTNVTTANVSSYRC